MTWLNPCCVIIYFRCITRRRTSAWPWSPSLRASTCGHVIRTTRTTSGNGKRRSLIGPKIRVESWGRTRSVLGGTRKERSALNLAQATGTWRHGVPSEAVRGWPATPRSQEEPSHTSIEPNLSRMLSPPLKQSSDHRVSKDLEKVYGDPVD